jgi:hypothetical protein
MVLIRHRRPAADSAGANARLVVRVRKENVNVKIPKLHRHPEPGSTGILGDEQSTDELGEEQSTDVLGQEQSTDEIGEEQSTDELGPEAGGTDIFGRQ